MGCVNLKKMYSARHKRRLVTQLYTDRTQMEVDPVDNDDQVEDTAEFDNARLEEEEEELFYPDEVDFDDMRRDSSSDEEGGGVGDSDEVDEVEGFLVGLRLWARVPWAPGIKQLHLLMICCGLCRLTCPA